MTWDEELFALLDDLESQAEAAYDAEREAELADRRRAEYATVSLGSRLMASAGREVVVAVQGVGVVAGRLDRLGDGWCHLTAVGQEWLVPWSAIRSVRGLSDRSLAEAAWSPLARLGLRSVLRRLADAQRPCLVHLLDETRHEALVDRVGHDFVELRTGPGGEQRLLVPFTALAAVASRD